MTSMLQKVRTLAVQAANGTNTTEDRAALKKESDALGQEFDRIVTQTRFGGKTIFDGGEAGKGSIYDGANGSDKTKGVMLLQVGGNKGDTISFTIEKMALSLVVNDKTVFDAAKGFALSTADGASKVIAAWIRTLLQLTADALTWAQSKTGFRPVSVTRQTFPPTRPMPAAA